jgi:hypothetical protein
VLRALVGAFLGGATGWSVVTISLAYELATITSHDLNFVNAVAIGCGAVAGSVMGATSAVTDAIRIRQTA